MNHRITSPKIGTPSITFSICDDKTAKIKGFFTTKSLWVGICFIEFFSYFWKPILIFYCIKIEHYNSLLNSYKYTSVFVWI